MNAELDHGYFIGRRGLELGFFGVSLDCLPDCIGIDYGAILAFFGGLDAFGAVLVDRGDVVAESEGGD